MIQTTYFALDGSDSSFRRQSQGGSCQGRTGACTSGLDATCHSGRVVG